MSEPVTGPKTCPLEYLLSLCRDGHYLGMDDLAEVWHWEMVKESDFTQNHKYQSSEDIVKHVPTGRHFEIANSRTGSYHTDWYYSKPTVREVKAVTKTIVKTSWVGI